MKLNLNYLVIITIVFASSCQGNKKAEPNAESQITKQQNLVDTLITPFLDTIQDLSLIAYLDSLPISNDTIYDVALSKNERTFSLYEYPRIRDEERPELGATESLNKILPFSTNEKRYYDLLLGITKEAFFLADNNNFSYPKEASNKPAQKGIKYSWGSKKFDKRENPPGERDSCEYEIYGLDCSGFIYQLFKRNNILLPTGRADDQRKVTTLQKALLPYFGKSTSFSVKDLGKIMPSNMETGDIIYFKNLKGVVVHIGIGLKNREGVLSFYESSGTPNSCEGNISSKKGIRGLILDSRIGNEGRDYSVVRITPL